MFHQLAVIVEALIGVFRRADVSHHFEDPKRGQRIDHEVEKDDRHEPLLLRGSQHPEDEEPRVRHSGKAHEPLHVTLTERCEVAKQQRGGGQEGQERNRHRLELGKGPVRSDEVEENENAPGLRSDGEQRGDRRGRALVDVGNPNLEGDEADLEGHPRNHEPRPDESEERLRPLVHAVVGREKLRQGPEMEGLGRAVVEDGVARGAEEQDNPEERQP